MITNRLLIGVIAAVLCSSVYFHFAGDRDGRDARQQAEGFDPVVVPPLSPFNEAQAGEDAGAAPIDPEYRPRRARKKKPHHHHVPFHSSRECPPDICRSAYSQRNEQQL